MALRIFCGAFCYGLSIVAQRRCRGAGYTLVRGFVVRENLMFCTKCGSYVPDGQHFCTSCGAPMEEFGPVDAAPAQPGYRQSGQTQQGYGQQAYQQPVGMPDASDLPPYMPPVDVPGGDMGMGVPGPQRSKKSGKKAALITVGVLVAILVGYIARSRPRSSVSKKRRKKTPSSTPGIRCASRRPACSGIPIPVPPSCRCM